MSASDFWWSLFMLFVPPMIGLVIAIIADEKMQDQVNQEAERVIQELKNQTKSMKQRYKHP